VDTYAGRIDVDWDQDAAVMREAEQRSLPYLSRIRLIINVRRAIERAVNGPSAAAGHDRQDQFIQLHLNGRGGYRPIPGRFRPACHAAEMGGRSAPGSEPENGYEETWIPAPYIPLGQYAMPTAQRADLTGILKGNPVFWNVSPA